MDSGYIYTKFIQIKDNNLYKTLEALEDLRLLKKLEFSDTPIDSCPLIKEAYYFKLSRVSYQILQYYDTHINNWFDNIYIPQSLQAQKNLLSEIKQALAIFKKFCEQNNTIEYFIICKEKNN